MSLLAFFDNIREIGIHMPECKILLLPKFVKTGISVHFDDISNVTGLGAIIVINDRYFSGFGEQIHDDIGIRDIQRMAHHHQRVF